MTAPYPCHFDSNSDETSVSVEDTVLIETADGMLELTTGSCITIPRNAAHRTAPIDGYSVNLTVEAAGYKLSLSLKDQLL